jgi:hypothetical protein
VRSAAAAEAARARAATRQQSLPRRPAATPSSSSVTPREVEGPGAREAVRPGAAAAIFAAPRPRRVSSSKQPAAELAPAPAPSVEAVAGAAGCQVPEPPLSAARIQGAQGAGGRAGPSRPGSSLSNCNSSSRGAGAGCALAQPQAQAQTQVAPAAAAVSAPLPRVAMLAAKGRAAGSGSQPTSSAASPAGGREPSRYEAILKRGRWAAWAAGLQPAASAGGQPLAGTHLPVAASGLALVGCMPSQWPDLVQWRPALNHHPLPAARRPQAAQPRRRRPRAGPAQGGL